MSSSLFYAMYESPNFLSADPMTDSESESDEEEEMPDAFFEPLRNGDSFLFGLTKPFPSRIDFAVPSPSPAVSQDNVLQTTTQVKSANFGNENEKPIWNFSATNNPVGLPPKEKHIVKESCDSDDADQYCHELVPLQDHQQFYFGLSSTASSCTFDFRFSSNSDP